MLIDRIHAMPMEVINKISGKNETFNFDLEKQKDYAMREAELMRRSIQVK